MQTKLTRIEQIIHLKAGDLINRFPSEGLPEDKFDTSRKEEIDTFEILSVNKEKQLFTLARTGNSVVLFTWPGDVEKMVVNPFSLIQEKRWWLA